MSGIELHCLMHASEKLSMPKKTRAHRKIQHQQSITDTTKIGTLTSAYSYFLILLISKIFADTSDFYATLLSKIWWRERDSNPRYPFRSIHDFQSCSFDHSDTSPTHIYELFLGPCDLLNGFLGPVDLLPCPNGLDWPPSRRGVKVFLGDFLPSPSSSSSFSSNALRLFNNFS